MCWWHEISQTAYSVSDPGVAQRKLAWWGQAVAEGFEHDSEHPNRPAPQHPLLQACLAPATRPHAPPLALWLRQIEGQQTLTEQTRWLDMPALERHARATTGAACEGAAWVLGARSDQALALAGQMGLGLRLAHILERLGQDTRQGWLHIPIDMLQTHNVRAHELLKPEQASATQGTPAAIEALLATWKQHSAALIDQVLQDARHLPKDEREAFRPLAVLCCLHRQLLDDLAAARYPVLHHRTLLGPWRKQWLARKAGWGWR